MMDTSSAIKIFGTLAHEHRLMLLRRLVVAGGEGLAVGELAQASAQNIKTVSAQLLTMADAGLLSSQRHGKSVIYKVDFEKLAALFAFVMNDCCGGHKALREKVLKACC